MTDDQSIIINNPDVIPAGDIDADMPPSYLANHIDWANKAYSEMMEHAAAAKREGRLAVSCAIRLGRELCIIKMHCQHGQWERLFAGAEKRLKNVDEPNGTHVSHFSFSRKTAERYMSAWKRIDAELDNEDQCKLAMAIQETPDSKPLPPSLLGKAGQAETLTQMYLDLGIISKPPAPTKAQHETILENRNTKGRPVKPLADKMSEAIALTTPVHIDPAVKSITANKDAAHILELLGQFDKDGMIDALNPADREWFALGLSEYAQKFSKRKSS